MLQTGIGFEAFRGRHKKLAGPTSRRPQSDLQLIAGSADKHNMTVASNLAYAGSMHKVSITAGESFARTRSLIGRNLGKQSRGRFAVDT